MGCGQQQTPGVWTAIGLKMQQQQQQQHVGPNSKRKRLLQCVVCRSEEFTQNEDGFYICNMCSTQSQEYVEEVLEDDDAFIFQTHTSQRVRTAAKPKRRKHNPSKLLSHSPPPPRCRERFLLLHNPGHGIFTFRNKLPAFLLASHMSKYSNPC